MALFKTFISVGLLLVAEICSGQQTYSDSIFTQGKTFAETLNNADVALTDVKHPPRFSVA